MKELHLVTVDDDGRLVLAGDGPEQYLLAVTDALRSAVRPDRGRAGQLEIALESQLTPKEIQTRIRHGESAEEVARAAGVPVERVRRFEGAVLAERSHIAEVAQRSSLRKGEPGSGPSALLADAVAARLSSRGLDAEHARWDAWRREDGRWTVEVTFRAGGGDKRGRFTYDATTRASVPADDDARWLGGEERAGDDTATRRGPRLVPVDDMPEPATEPAAEPVAEAVAVEFATVPGGSEDPLRATSAAAADAGPVEPELKEEGRRGGRRNRRSSVPSWDEIVFGRRGE